MPVKDAESNRILNYLLSVKNQYEDYPYPPRDVSLEKKRTFYTLSDFLDALNHQAYGGKQTFDDGFRVLVAGGGTGDATIFLAEQLHGRKAEVLHLDISRASNEICRQRAETRGLTNIKFVEDSILNIPYLGMADFDYINCVGVLHHLEDPAKGLQVLASVLKQDGAMGLMLYGQYGRTAVYQVQELMRRINRYTDDIEEKISNTKKILRHLPERNWFRHCEDFIQDHRHSDAGIYDLLLHSQDRAYTVDEVYDLAKSAGLKLLRFRSKRGEAAVRYSPESYIKDAALSERIRQYEPRQRQAIAELLAGDMHKHSFLVSKSIAPEPSVSDLEMIPSFSLAMFPEKNLYEKVYRAVSSARSKKRVIMRRFDVVVSFPYHAVTEGVFRYLDGERTMREIVARVRTSLRRGGKPVPDADDVVETFKPVFRAMNTHEWMFLRHRSVGQYRFLSHLIRPKPSAPFTR